ncbi:MAG: hypothetical protein IJG75_02280 [Spirochaetia bacterium]|nr:hypothetical protein [Spirochaetia bacterium]MBR0318529.1 hypothetical protein [Spirochaetia bacterium]
MKTKHLLFILLALCVVFFLAGCDSGGGGSSSGGDNGGGNNSVALEPYLPAEFSGLTIGECYIRTETETSTIEGVEYTKKKIDAVYLFTNNTWVKTQRKIYINKSTGAVDDSKKKEHPDNKGTFTLNSGNYSNGTATITPTHEWNEETSAWDTNTPGPVELTITNGSFTAMGDTFTKK